jgi:hypothetical protein
MQNAEAEGLEGPSVQRAKWPNGQRAKTAEWVAVCVLVFFVPLNCFHTSSDSVTSVSLW